jgi:hypothetical protein
MALLAEQGKFPLPEPKELRMTNCSSTQILGNHLPQRSLHSSMQAKHNGSDLMYLLHHCSMPNLSHLSVAKS